MRTQRWSDLKKRKLTPEQVVVSEEWANEEQAKELRRYSRRLLWFMIFGRILCAASAGWLGCCAGFVVRFGKTESLPGVTRGLLIGNMLLAIFVYVITYLVVWRARNDAQSCDDALNRVIQELRKTETPEHAKSENRSHVS